MSYLYKVIVIERNNAIDHGLHWYCNLELLDHRLREKTIHSTEISQGDHVLLASNEHNTLNIPRALTQNEMSAKDLLLTAVWRMHHILTRCTGLCASRV